MDTNTEFNTENVITHVYIPKLDRAYNKYDIDAIFHVHRIAKVVSIEFVELKIGQALKNTRPKFVSAFIALQFYTPASYRKAFDAKTDIRTYGSYDFYIKNSSANPNEYWLLLHNKNPVTIFKAPVVLADLELEPFLVPLKMVRSSANHYCGDIFEDMQADMDKTLCEA